jgi:DNA-binding NarL/FixJ family response regulator
MTERRCSPDKFCVLLVEDHMIFREQLTNLIQQQPDMCVSGGSDNVRQAVSLIESNPPDVILLDLSLKGPGGLELLKELKTRAVAIPALVLSMHDEVLYAERVLRAGARGYITKHETSTEVLIAIRQVARGEIYLSKRTASRVFESLAGRTPEQRGVERLTDRELEIFELIGGGRSTREISSRLHLGVSTVETYRARIKEKLNLESSSQLTHEAIQWVSLERQAASPA